MIARPRSHVGAVWLVAAMLAWSATGRAQADRTVTIGGRIVDPDGEPVRDARVALLVDKGQDLRCERGPGTEACFETIAARGAVRAEGRSGPDGRFAFSVPDGLRNSDHFWADGQDSRGRRVQNSWPIHPNRPITTTDLGTIALNRERELVVLVQGDGRPVVDAEVEFNRREKHRTDRDGTAVYRFLTPAASESSLTGMAFTVRAPGFAVDAWFGGVPSGSTTHVIEIVPDAPLAGRVFDPNGAPVPGAVVAVRPIEPWLGPVFVNGGMGPPDDTIARTRTDQTGGFVLHGLSPARTYRVAVDPPGQAPVAGLERDVEGGSPPMNFVLSSAGRVEIEVTGSQGTETFLRRLRDSQGGLFGRPISIEWFDTASGAWQTVASPGQVVQAASGRVRLRFAQVPGGSIRIVTDGDGSVAGDVSDIIMVGAGGTSVVSLPVVPARSLRLRVNDTEGRPVRGARVEVFAHTGRSSTYVNTGADGVATLLVHPAHDLTVTVAIAGRTVATTVVSAGVEIPPSIVVSAR